jgi:hypothetical protein
MAIWWRHVHIHLEATIRPNEWHDTCRGSNFDRVDPGAIRQITETTPRRPRIEGDRLRTEPSRTHRSQISDDYRVPAMNDSSRLNQPNIRPCPALRRLRTDDDSVPRNRLVIGRVGVGPAHDEHHAEEDDHAGQSQQKIPRYIKAFTIQHRRPSDLEPCMGHKKLPIW